MSWFPLAKDVMEDPFFQQLTPTEKIVFWWLTSEYNMNDWGFYLSDTQFAVTLGCTEKTIQRARKKIHAHGWINYQPGWRDANMDGLATTYSEVQYATKPGENCTQFAQQNRFAFQQMVSFLRSKRFQPGDIVTYVYLNYWRQLRGNNTIFYITKRDFCVLTRISDAPARVKRLYEKFTYRNSDNHLFSVEGYHYLKFSAWNEPTDPEKDEMNRKIAESWEASIRDETARRREDRILCRVSR